MTRPRKCCGTCQCKGAGAAAARRLKRFLIVATNGSMNRFGNGEGSIEGSGEPGEGTAAAGESSWAAQTATGGGRAKLERGATA